MAGEEDEAAVVSPIPDPSDHIEPGAARHFDVANHDVRPLGLVQLLGILYVIGGQQLVYTEIGSVHDPNQSLDRWDIVVY